MTLTYNLNIPNAPNNPSSDQPLMQQNTNSINTIIGVDHQSFSATNSGYHTVIHQGTGGITRSGVGATYTNLPANIVGINQVFSALYTPDATGAGTDTQLFNLTGLGGASQLTGNNANNDGWVWTGGILIQWGIVTSGGNFVDGSTGTVTFKDRTPNCIPFPNNCFIIIPNIMYTITAPSSQNAGVTIIDSNSISKTKFTWTVKLSSTSNKYTSFQWLAIGN